MTLYGRAVTVLRQIGPSRRIGLTKRHAEAE